MGFGSWWAAGRLCLLPLRMGTRLRGCDICPLMRGTRFVSNRPQELHLFFSLRNADMWLVPWGSIRPKQTVRAFLASLQWRHGGTAIVWVASLLSQGGSGRSRLRCSGGNLT